MNPSIVLILHDIRSAHNVGSMFRTADGAGVSRIFLSGYTQAPAEERKRFPTDAEKAIRKTALGAEYAVPWERSDGELARLFDRLRHEGYLIVSLEQADGSLDYRDFSPDRPVALVVGNETAGVSGETLAMSDVILEIPMAGVKESLNVSVATGIALFSLTGTMKKDKP